MDFIQSPTNPVISLLSCLHWQLHWQSKSWEVLHVVCIDSHCFWTVRWCQLDSVTGIFLHQLHGDALLPLASITRSDWFYSDHDLLLIDMYGALVTSPHFIRAFTWGLCPPTCSFPLISSCTALHESSVSAECVPAQECSLFLLSIVGLMMLFSVAFAIYQV